MGRPSYHHHAAPYRSINPGDDLSKPWENSPFSDYDLPLSPLRPVFDIPKSSQESRTSSSPSSPTVSVLKVPGKKKGLWARIRRFLRSGSFSLDEEIIIPAFDPGEPNPLLSAKVELHEWKQYGYWVRPILNDVMVANSPVSSEKSISTSVLQERIRGLLGPDDSPRPQIWIPGTKHRSLPQRPHRWKDPVPNEPLPFPWEVKINPLLQHPLWGPSPLTWCLFHHPSPQGALRYGRTAFPVHCDAPDLAQPATWPFLTYMHFNAVAGDTAPTFPWPFTVHNPRGIKVGDILTEIWQNFQVPTTNDEKMSWPPLRREAAERARLDRCRMQKRGNLDDLRRCDALGGIMWFRGIEPTINGGGWMITFGTH